MFWFIQRSKECVINKNVLFSLKHEYGIRKNTFKSPGSIKDSDCLSTRTSTRPKKPNSLYGSEYLVGDGFISSPVSCGDSNQVKDILRVRVREDKK